MRLTAKQLQRAKYIADTYTELEAYEEALEIFNQGADEVTLRATTPIARELVATTLQGVIDALTDELLAEIDALV